MMLHECFIFKVTKLPWMKAKQ